MSGNQQTPPADPPHDPPQEPRADETTDQPKAAKAKAEPPKRYAAFNMSLGKYVGGVRDTKGEATKIAKGITDAGYTAEVREV